MTHEINAEFYCGAFERPAKDCPDYGTCERLECEAYHRKWPTPEQFKAEYGREHPDDGPVWERLRPMMNAGVVGDWILKKHLDRCTNDTTGYCVCACSPFGKPPDDWRPE